MDNLSNCGVKLRSILKLDQDGHEYFHFQVLPFTFDEGPFPSTPQQPLFHKRCNKKRLWKFCDARPPENCRSFVRSLPPIDEASPGASSIDPQRKTGPRVQRFNRHGPEKNTREQREKVGNNAPITRNI
jgi:hypothetical protein